MSRSPEDDDRDRRTHPYASAGGDNNGGKGHGRLPPTSFSVERVEDDVEVVEKISLSEDVAEFFHDFFFRVRASDRQLLYKQVARRVEHLAFPER